MFSLQMKSCQVDIIFTHLISDSLSDRDRDPSKFLKVGNSRALLEAVPDTTNDSEKRKSQL